MCELILKMDPHIAIFKMKLVEVIVSWLTIRLYKLERIFLQQVDLKSVLDSKDFLLNKF